MKEGNENVLARVNAGRFSSRTAKTTSMKAQLEDLARTSQKGVQMLLKAQDFKFRSFWITNQLFVNEATEELVQLIAADPQVAMINAEEHFNIVEPIPAEQSINAEWGIEIIEAPDAWVLPGGNNGQGVVVSTIDTGVRYTHEALASNYRNDGYGWYDPYDGSSNPIDENGHGSHTMGTIAGANGIGVAPGAQWIACRGCDTSSCSQFALTACGEWTACPTRADGSGADCSKAPALSSNSWGGGQGSTSYLAVVNAWHAAGVIPIFAMGNSGPSCGTANSPGDLTNVIGVGSTDSSDTVSSFSSRGPAVAGHVKPDIAAPGSSVRSSWYTTDTAYNTISGTSMATPHVAGATALLLAANPNLSYAQVVAALTENTDQSLGSAATCGGTPPNQFPNNIYGHGRLNARKALASVIG